MTVHICLLFDADSALIKSTIIDIGSNGVDVRTEAQRQLVATPGAVGYELWLDGDKVYSHFPGRNNDSLG